MKSLSIWGPICGDSSLKFKFLRAGDFFALFSLASPLVLTVDGSKRFQTMDPLYDTVFFI